MAAGSIGTQGCGVEVDINKDASKTADFSTKVCDVLSGKEKLTLQHKHIAIVKSAALATGAVGTIRFPGSLVIFCGNK